MKIVIERMKKPDHDNFIFRDLKTNALYGVVYCDLFFNTTTKKNEFSEKILPGKSAVVEVIFDYEIAS